jgi:hypothetical protein
MYRKVHNTMLAFSATGVLLLVGLMAGVPATQAPQPLVRTVAIGPLVVQLTSPPTASAQARAASIETRAEALEAQIGASTSTADSIAHVVSFAAGVATETALLAAFADELDAAAATANVEEDRAGADDDRQNQRRHVRRAREALALPYFSFAQGLRRNRS